MFETHESAYLNWLNRLDAHGAQLTTTFLLGMAARSEEYRAAADAEGVDYAAPRGLLECLAVDAAQVRDRLLAEAEATAERFEGIVLNFASDVAMDSAEDATRRKRAETVRMAEELDAAMIDGLDTEALEQRLHDQMTELHAMLRQANERDNEPVSEDDGDDETDAR